MIKIILADDHKIVRDGIRAQLSNESNYQIIAEASDGQEVLELLKTKDADLVIMDINMKGMDGISCTKELTKLYSSVKVLALTMLGENQYIKQMLQAGAAGYLLKNCEEDELKKAINSIHSGENYYSSDVTRIIMNNLRKQPTKPKRNTTIQIPLTSREKQVLRLIMKEYSNKEISDELFIGLRTVDSHKRNLLEKTGARNVAGLVLYAIDQQIFDDL